MQNLELPFGREFSLSALQKTKEHRIFWENNYFVAYTGGSGAVFTHWIRMINRLFSTFVDDDLLIMRRCKTIATASAFQYWLEIIGWVKHFSLLHFSA